MINFAHGLLCIKRVSLSDTYRVRDMIAFVVSGVSV